MDIRIAESNTRPWVELTAHVGLNSVAWSWPSPAGRTWEVKQVRHDAGVDSIVVGSRRQAETALRMLAGAFRFGTGR
ncbi:hypothetical protein BST24_08480 [Mycobacteroides franklinii]|nr:hypothetical protein BST24_08480 [Mycobacteroides franklinii]